MTCKWGGVKKGFGKIDMGEEGGTIFNPVYTKGEKDWSSRELFQDQQTRILGEKITNCELSLQVLFKRQSCVLIKSLKYRYKA